MAATAVNPETVRRDIRALTGLRAVAAAVVVLFHISSLAGVYLDRMPMLRPLVDAGWTGVELFFVLSGFVITLSYIDRVGHRPTLRTVGHFVFNRFARVWPAWATVAVLVGAWLFTLRVLGGDPDAFTAHPPTDVPNLLQHLTMTQMWGTVELRGSSYVPPGWSISAEWAAYLAFPLLAVLLRPLRRLPAVVLLALGVLAMSPLALMGWYGIPEHAQHWGVRIACGFVAGILTALGVRRLRRTQRVESVAFAVLCASLIMIAVVLLWASARRGGDFSRDYAGVVVLVFPVLIASLAFTDRGPARWLASGPMTYGGRMSYCLYLVHYSVMDIVLTVWWQDPATRGVITPAVTGVLPLIVLLSYLLGAALHHGVEEPARRRLLRLLDRRQRSVGAPAIAVRRAPAPRPADQVPAPRSAASDRRPVPVGRSVDAARRNGFGGERSRVPGARPVERLSRAGRPRRRPDRPARPCDGACGSGGPTGPGDLRGPAREPAPDRSVTARLFRSCH